MPCGDTGSVQILVLLVATMIWREENDYDILSSFFKKKVSDYFLVYKPLVQLFLVTTISPAWHENTKVASSTGRC